MGAPRTVGCFVNSGADCVAPGVVRYAGRGAVVAGELDGTATPRIDALLALMRDFDDAIIVTPDIWGYLWDTMTYGALLFGTALTDDSIAGVLADPACRPVLTALGQEVGAIAAAEGVTPEGFDAFDPAAFAPGAGQTALDRSFAETVAHDRRSTKTDPGIWRDLAIRKRKTEREAQLGLIVASGRTRDRPTPLTKRLMATTAEIEAGRRPLARANLTELGGAAA